MGGTTTPTTGAASPDAPGSSSRRGLRTRTAAQQRPYFHNAQVFDELVAEPEAEPGTPPSSPKPKQKLKLTGLTQVSFPEFDEGPAEDEIAIAMYGYGGGGMLEETPQPPRKARKGRAWRKNSDEEDQDYKSPAKIKSSQPTRKVDRRKSNQDAEDMMEEPESPEKQRQGDRANKGVEPATQSPTSKAGKKPRKPRKISHLSEEFVKDDSDTAMEELQEPKSKVEPEKTQAIAMTNPAQKTPKKKGRPRKSDQGSAPKPGKEKAVTTEDLGSAGKSSHTVRPAEAASAPTKEQKKSPAIDAKTTVQSDDTESRLAPESTTPTYSPPPHPLDLSAILPPLQDGSEKSDVISLSASDSASDLDTEPEVISAKPSSRRALASDLQALDDSGKPVTLSAPPGVEAARAAAVAEQEGVQGVSPPVEST